MEVSALAEVFCKNRTSPLLVGSCKSNLGHTEACSGLVSLLKCVMSIQHSIIPPNVCYNQPIPEIAEIMKHQLKIVTEPTKLPSK
uniref:Ketosynthase family 3 (KS3) domain-containing protein n=1 Tax=Octopus bimaculoides TaxID=37653 RepID=A0A0L8H468_OCTBM